MTAGTPRSLPPDFASSLEALLAPGESDAAARVLIAALGLDDGQLAGYLDAVAERVRQSARPVTALELRALLEALSVDPE